MSWNPIKASLHPSPGARCSSKWLQFVWSVLREPKRDWCSDSHCLNRAPLYMPAMRPNTQNRTHTHTHTRDRKGRGAFRAVFGRTHSCIFFSKDPWICDFSPSIFHKYKQSSIIKFHKSWWPQPESSPPPGFEAADVWHESHTRSNNDCCWDNERVSWCFYTVGNTNKPPRNTASQRMKCHNSSADESGTEAAAANQGLGSGKSWLPCDFIFAIGEKS